MAILERNAIACSDALDYLRSLPAESVHCCVTSPPYLMMRKYSDDLREFGRTPSVKAYVEGLVEILREVRRVLRSDGALFLNLGDTASDSGNGGNPAESPFRKQATNAGSLTEPKRIKELPRKSWCLVPQRTVCALQDDGWIVRDEIIWHKANAMPFSGTDRTTRAHEQIFMLTKKPNYWYDKWAIAEPLKTESELPAVRGVSDHHKNLHIPGQAQHSMHKARPNGQTYHTPLLANKRSVWKVNVGSFKGAHFATFPPKLIEPMVLAGCPEFVCSKCGKGYVRSTPAKVNKVYRESQGGANDGANNKQPYQTNNPHRERLLVRTLVADEAPAWRPACRCNAEATRGVVLDPFMGSGTTALVARDLGRDYIGCDLNPSYVELALGRLYEPQKPPKKPKRVRALPSIPDPFLPSFTELFKEYGYE